MCASYVSFIGTWILTNEPPGKPCIYRQLLPIKTKDVQIFFTEVGFSGYTFSHKYYTGTSAFDTTWNKNLTSPGILQVRMLEWVAFPFSRGSSQPRVRTQVSLIARGFFTS